MPNDSKVFEPYNVFHTPSSRATPLRFASSGLTSIGTNRAAAENLQDSLLQDRAAPEQSAATEGVDVQQALEKRVSTSADPIEPVRQDNATGARPKVSKNTVLDQRSNEQLETPNIQPKPGQGLTNYTDVFSRLLAEVIADRESSNNDYANSNVPDSWFSVDKNDLDKYTEEVNKRLGELRDNDLSIHLANSLSQRDYSTITWKERVNLLEKAAERNKPDDKTTPEKRKWYEETKKEAEILKEAGKNVGEDGKISISYSHIDAPGNPGKARVYMAIFERSDDGSYKDVQQNDKGELKKLGDKPMWIGIGAPHRALSYLHKYRLSGAARPVIRSFLVDKSFLEEHLPRIETESSRKDPDGTRLMNVDTKEYNQFEMKVSTKEKKEFKETKINEKTGEEMIITKKKDVMVDSSLFDSLLKNAVPGSLQTIAYPDYRDSHSESEGTLISVDEFERDLGYKSGVSVSSRDNVFGKLAKKNNDWVFPSSEVYVDKVTEMRSTFDILEKLGTSEVTDLLLDKAIWKRLKNNLGDLLEANKMTPAAVLGENFETSELKKKVLENSRTEKDFLTAVLNSSNWHNTAQEIAGRIGKFIEEDAHKVKNKCLELEEELRSEKNTSKQNKIKKSLQSVSSRSATNILLRNHYIQSDLSRLGFPPTEEGLTAALKALAEGKLKDKPSELLKILFHTFRPLATQVEHKEGKALPFPHAIDGVDDADKVKVNNRTAVKDLDLLLNSSHRTKTRDDIFQSDRNYVPDMFDPMTTYMRDRSIPFVGGISGTTRDISSRLKEIIGDLSAEAYWTLQLMNAAFMIDNGYHSFFETMYPAARYDTKSPVGKQIVKKIDEMKTGATIDTPSVYGDILNLIPGVGPALAKNLVAHNSSETAITSLHDLTTLKKEAQTGFAVRDNLEYFEKKLGSHSDSSLTDEEKQVFQQTMRSALLSSEYSSSPREQGPALRGLRLYGLKVLSDALKQGYRDEVSSLLNKPRYQAVNSGPTVFDHLIDTTLEEKDKEMRYTMARLLGPFVSDPQNLTKPLLKMIYKQSDTPTSRYLLNLIPKKAKRGFLVDYKKPSVSSRLFSGKKDLKKVVEQDLERPLPLFKSLELGTKLPPISLSHTQMEEMVNQEAKRLDEHKKKMAQMETDEINQLKALNERGMTGSDAEKAVRDARAYFGNPSVQIEILKQAIAKHESKVAENEARTQRLTQMEQAHSQRRRNEYIQEENRQEEIRQEREYERARIEHQRREQERYQAEQAHRQQQKKLKAQSSQSGRAVNDPQQQKELKAQSSQSGRAVNGPQQQQAINNGGSSHSSARPAIITSNHRPAIAMDDVNQQPASSSTSVPTDPRITYQDLGKVKASRVVAYNDRGEKMGEVTTNMGQHIEISKVDELKKREVPPTGNAGSGSVIRQYTVPGTFSESAGRISIQPPKNETQKISISQVSSGPYDSLRQPTVSVHLSLDQWRNALK